VRALVELADEPGVQARCAAVAAGIFSLADGVRAFDALYREVVATRA
jgi:hypothetical protein